MADNFSDNPLVGFDAFQRAAAGAPGSDPRLVERGLSTHTLEGLKADVLAGRLPQVSYVIAPAAASEHPGPSSPAQGAVYTAQVIEALTANPETWAQTVLLINFDENDGFFDHVPPPAPPSRGASGDLRGASTVALDGEYHVVASESDAWLDKPEYRGRPYGLGPRVPMYAVSPWSTGGYVCSEVFDHTSVIRFLERRFGVLEPNISPWRRAVCGDLLSCFDFSGATYRPLRLPDVTASATRAAAQTRTVIPPTPTLPRRPSQAAGFRPARPTAYALECVWVRAPGEAVTLRLLNYGSRAAVFHVYDRLKLEDGPYRYTVSGHRHLDHALTSDGVYDLQVMGPDGFHRRFSSEGTASITASLTFPARGPLVQLSGMGSVRVTTPTESRVFEVSGDCKIGVAWMDPNRRYDITVEHGPRRLEFAGRAPLRSPRKALQGRLLPIV
jgi:phospholipase C